MTGMAAGVARGGIVIGGGGGKLYDVAGYDVSFWLLAPSTAGGGANQMLIVHVQIMRPITIDGTDNRGRTAMKLTVT